MQEIAIKNFKGVFNKASKFDLPEVFAETCKDFLPTYEGKLVKRSGYAAATLNSVTFATTGLAGNIINLIELVTGRSSTSAPNEAVKYLCQTDDGNGKIYWWNESGTPTWTRLDNSLTDFRNAAGTVQKCKFVVEDGIIRILCGNRSVNYPLWWGYCGERFTNAISANAGTKTAIAAGYPTYAYLANLQPPSATTYLNTVTVFEVTGGVTWNNGITLPAETTSKQYGYYYRISLQYDSKQWSPPSLLSNSHSFIESSSISEIYLKVPLLFTIDSTTMDKRITGFKIYRGKAVGGSSAYINTDYADYKLLFNVNFNESWGTFNDPTYRIWPTEGSQGYYAVFTKSSKSFKLTPTLADDDAVLNDMYNGALLIVYDPVLLTTSTCRITDCVFTSTSNQVITISDDTGLVDGTSYVLSICQGWLKNGNNYQCYLLDTYSDDSIAANPTMLEDLGITEESYTTVNSKYGTTINGQAFYANCYHYNETKEYLVAYGMLNGGLFSNDAHNVLNAFTVGFPIKGISAIGDRLIIYGDAQISRGIIPTANESSWDFEKLFEQYGLLAENSLITIQGKDYFLATDWTIKEFDGSTRPRTISDGIYDVLVNAGTSSIAYLQNVIAFFVPKLNYFMIRIQTGASSYQYWAYDLRGELGWIQFAWADTFTGFLTTKDGDALAFKANAVLKLNSGSDDNGTKIDPTYKTLPITIDKAMKHHFSKMDVTYKSDTAINEKIYLNASATALTQVSEAIAAQTILKTASKSFPLSTNGRFIQLEFGLTTALKATNTYYELDEIILPVELSGG